MQNKNKKVAIVAMMIIEFKYLYILIYSVKKETKWKAVKGLYSGNFQK